MPDDNVTRASDKDMKGWQDAEQKRTGKKPAPEQYVEKVIGELFEDIYTPGTDAHKNVYDGWVSKEEKDELQADLKQLEQKAEQKILQIKQDYETKAENAVRGIIKRYETKAEEDKNSYKEKDEQIAKCEADVQHREKVCKGINERFDDREAEVKRRLAVYDQELQKAAAAAGVTIPPRATWTPDYDPVKVIVEVIEARQKNLAESDKRLAMQEKSLKDREEMASQGMKDWEEIREEAVKQGEEVRGISDAADRLYFHFTGKRILDLPGHNVSECYERAGVELQKYVDGLLKRETLVKEGEKENERKRDKLVGIDEELEKKRKGVEDKQTKLDADRRDLDHEKTSYEIDLAKYQTDVEAFEKKLASYDADLLSLGKERRLVDAEREKLTQEKADVAAGRAKIADYEQHKVELDKREADLKAAEELNKRKMKNLELMAGKLEGREKELDERQVKVDKEVDSMNETCGEVEKDKQAMISYAQRFDPGIREYKDAVAKVNEVIESLENYEERLTRQEQEVDALIKAATERKAELDGREEAVTVERGKLKEAYSALNAQVKRHTQKDDELKAREQAIQPREGKLATEEEKLKGEKVAMVERIKKLQETKEKIAKSEEELKSYEKVMIDGLKGIVGEQPDFPGYITALKDYVNGLGEQEEEIEKRERQVVPREAAVDDANKKLKEHELDVEKNLENQRAELEQDRAKLDADKKVLYQEMEEVRRVKAALEAGTGTTQAKRSTAKAVKPVKAAKQGPEETDRPAKILVMEEPEQPTQRQGPAYEPYYVLIQDEGDVRKVMGPYGLVEGKDYKFERDGSGVKRARVLTPEADSAWRGSQQPVEDAIEVEEEPVRKARKKVRKQK
jgi:uncharacterized protein (DUF3084 family)